MLEKVFALIFCFIILGIGCAFAGELTIKAKDMLFKSTGGESGDCWNISSNGYLSESLDFPAGGSYKFTVRAKGDKAFGIWPVMTVLCNEKKEFMASVDSAEIKEYSIPVKVEKGPCIIKIQFGNDDYNKELNEDRNLRVELLKVENIAGNQLPRRIGKEEMERITVIRKKKLMQEVKARTEKIRKGELQIRVVDPTGKPVNNAVVKVDQKKHEFLFGTAISSRVFTRFDSATREKYLKVLKENFNYAVHENALKWESTESERGIYTYETLDKILAWCSENGIGIRGHCIFWEVGQYVQKWIKKLSNDELKQAVNKRGEELTARYRHQINEFDVNNEMLHGDFYKSRLGESIWKDMFLAAKKGNPEAVLYVNDYEIMINNLMDEKYSEHIKKFLDSGVPVGGIGIQGHFVEAVDPFRVENSLDVLSKFDLPIKITEFDIDNDDEKVKAEGLETLYRICFSHPKVNGILMWGFWEGAHWRKRAAIFNKDFVPGPAALAYRELVYNEWWTKTEGSTDKNGRFSCGPFYGEHLLTITPFSGKVVTKMIILSSIEKSKTVEVVIE